MSSYGVLFSAMTTACKLNGLAGVSRQSSVQTLRLELGSGEVLPDPLMFCSLALWELLYYSGFEHRLPGDVWITAKVRSVE